VEVDNQVPAVFANFLAMHMKIHDINIHAELQYDLVEHL
jgi:hypothetical protein